MKDSLLQLHEFVNSVVSAMNAANVIPTEEKEAVCGVIVIFAPSDRSAPLSCSLNYERVAKQWSSYDPEMTIPDSQMS